MGAGLKLQTLSLSDTHELEGDISQFPSHTIFISLTNVVKAV